VEDTGPHVNADCGLSSTGCSASVDGQYFIFRSMERLLLLAVYVALGGGRAFDVHVVKTFDLPIRGFLSSTAGS
jgi:hypothetical protein